MEASVYIKAYVESSDIYKFTKIINGQILVNEIAAT